MNSESEIAPASAEPEPAALIEEVVHETAVVAYRRDRLLASLESEDDDCMVLSTGLATVYPAGISVKW